MCSVWRMLPDDGHKDARNMLRYENDERYQLDATIMIYYHK